MFLIHLDQLVKALGHEDPDTRRKVAGALKQLEDSRATEPLIRAFEREREGEIRRDLVN